MRARLGRIFLVEDEALIAMELQDQLETLGYEVCGHAARARTALEDIPRTRPDLVIMDINLGRGASGIDIAEKLRESVDVPILYLSAYADEELLSRAAKTAPFAYMTKPFDVRVLSANVALAIERHRAAHVLRASEARFHELFELGPDATLMVNASGEIVLANRRAETMFRCVRAALVGKQISELLPALPEEATKAFGSRDEEMTLQLPGRRADGETFPTEVRRSRLRAEEGTHTVVTLRDVSARVKAEEERKRLDAHLRQTQKMEAMGTLAGGVAHDFNNVLAAILANLELVRRDIADEQTSSALKCLEAIEAATMRATELVRQILSFSRGSGITRSVLALHRVVEEAAMLLRASLPARIRLSTFIHPETPPVLADPTLLHQVLMNLGTNAWHAIEGQGEISLRVDRVEADGAEMARIEVRDDGTGMEPQLIERIFDPFFTTKEVGKGTGLGLSVVRGIVEEHGGRIRVESQLGTGSVFRILIPAVSAEVESGAASTTAVRGGHGHVLYVDDEPAIVVALTRLLGHLGYTPAGYVCAADAIEAVRAEPDRFDVLITDYHMPELSGLDVGRAVRAIREDLPIILVSGVERPGIDLSDRGITLFLEKPFSLDALDAALRKLTSVRRRGRDPD